MMKFAQQAAPPEPKAETPDREEHIAPAPRVSVQAFCETVETAGAIQAAAEDRRLGKAHINADYAYATVAKGAKKVDVVIGVSDLAGAIKALRGR